MTFDPAEAAAILKAAGVTLNRGLSDRELDRCEERYEIAFSPDHRAFLLHALPFGEGWYDWRSRLARQRIERAIRWPVEGLLSHVDSEDFWDSAWGLRPCQPDEAHAVAASQLASVPRLVPVYLHRYAPPAPAPEGAPVLSAHASDVIYYGFDLMDYLRAEWLRSSGRRSLDQLAYRVPFWSDLAED